MTMQLINRVKNAALKELQKIAIESLTDDSVFDETDLEELSSNVIEMIGSERMPEEVYFAQYEKGYEAGMRKIATWMSEEQLRNYCKPQDYGDFAVLPKEIGEQAAYLEGFHWGVQTAKWYKYNLDQIDEKGEYKQWGIG